MSYTEIASKPATATLRQVMNAGRSERAPSRATSSGKPRQRLHEFHGTRRRHRTNRQIRRAELAPEARHHELLGSSNLSVQVTQLTIRALDSRCAAGDASGRHLPPTFQRRAPRFRSATTTARRERRDSRHAARFAQLAPKPRSPVRRPWRWTGQGSDASVTTRRETIAATHRLAKTAFPAAP